MSALTKINISISLPVPAIFVRIAVWTALLYRRLRYGYAFRRIRLTQGYFAIISPADYPSLSKYNWRLCRSKGKNKLYAERSIRLPAAGTVEPPNGKYSRILMHREVLKLPQITSHLPPAATIREHDGRVPNLEPRVTSHLPRQCASTAGEPPVTKFVIDHINGNGLDNRRENLRLATVAQNAWNSKRRNSRSGYKGVWFAADKGKWRAAIVFHGQRMHLGYFKDKVEAAREYDKAARKHFGQFAYLNFPDEKANSMG